MADRRQQGRMTGHGYTSSSSCERDCSGELRMLNHHRAGKEMKMAAPIRNQRNNGPVNAHLISGPSIRTKHTPD